MEKITLNKISYKYPKTKVKVLDNISIELLSGKSYAIVGKSGSGKTTLIDILIGLLEPDIGSISLDGNKLKRKDTISTTLKVGYVPQTPFIADDSLKNNIAFGVSEKEININLLKKCLSTAQMEEFLKKLKYDFNSNLGDFGSKISGGQRQRIAIARGLQATTNYFR